MESISIIINFGLLRIIGIHIVINFGLLRISGIHIIINLGLLRISGIHIIINLVFLRIGKHRLDRRVCNKCWSSKERLYHPESLINLLVVSL